MIEAERAAVPAPARQGPADRHGEGDPAHDAASTAAPGSRSWRIPTGRTRLLALNPLLQVATKVRNAESLMRLEELALR